MYFTKGSQFLTKRSKKKSMENRLCPERNLNLQMTENGTTLPKYKPKNREKKKDKSTANIVNSYKYQSQH